MRLSKKISTLSLSALLACSAVIPADAAKLTGAGATFPYPIYSKWFDEYNRVKPDVQINYQSIGSGGGVRQFTQKTVDFGATDGPMTEKEAFGVDGKFLHIPTVLGAVVLAFNVPGLRDLNLSGEVVADIYLGKIKTWNDAAIAALNPGVSLPDNPIVVARRADGSGTTYCFTDYLSNVSAEWKKRVGTGKAVSWPVGLGGKGNEGVAGLVKNTPFSIGYVELIYAKQTGMPYAAVKNRAGKFVKASIESVTAAAAQTKMPADYRVSIVNAAGEESYPISTYTWLLVYQNTGGENGDALKGFLKWMATNGQPMAAQLGYAPLPSTVQSMVIKSIETLR